MSTIMRPKPGNSYRPLQLVDLCPQAHLFTPLRESGFTRCSQRTRSPGVSWGERKPSSPQVTLRCEGSISIPISTKYATDFQQKICQKARSINRVNEVNCLSNQSFIHHAPARVSERTSNLSSTTAKRTGDTCQKPWRAFLSGKTTCPFIPQDLQVSGLSIVVRSVRWCVGVGGVGPNVRLMIP